MIKKIDKSINNSSASVDFVLRCSKKRRSMALASAKMLNADMGLQSKLIALP